MPHSRGGRMRRSEGPRSGSCLKKEPIFNSLLAGLLLEPHTLSYGSIVDAGAHVGSESCLYAQSAPARVVHAVEPMWANVQTIRRSLSHLANVQVIQGGLGDKPAMVQPSSGMHTVGQMFSPTRLKRRKQADEGSPKEGVNHTIGAKALSPRSWFPVYRLDDLFKEKWRDEALALAHFDVTLPFARRAQLPTCCIDILLRPHFAASLPYRASGGGR